jgi:protein CpxP
MNIKTNLTAIVVCSGLLFSSLSHAGSSHHHGKHFLLTDRAAAKLSLTDEQQKEIARILTEKRTQIKAAKAMGSNNKDAFKDIVETDSFDEQRAKEVIAQMQEVKAQMLLAKLKSKQQIWLLLDEQQREKLTHIKKKRMRHN